MPLLTIRNLSIRYRGPALLDEVSCVIEPAQRIGLLGRNGSGKTTLMRIIQGEVEPDAGEVIFAPGTKVSVLPQDVPQDIHGSITEIVSRGMPYDPEDHDAAWRAEHAVEKILTRMELPGEQRFETLSSGMKRRVLLAQSLVSSPDILLLDEPTNHLDIAAITWLEEFLSRWNATFIFVTHDRMFLRRLAQRIIEIDRGRLFDWSCDYATFLTRKEAALAAEEKQNALFDKKLAQEEVWVRTGIKARRTRNEGRVRALEELRRVRADRREITGKVNLEIQEGQKSGMLVAEVEDISFSYGNRPIVQNFSTTIMRGDKIGIIGPNGVGKTTFLRIILGQLTPQTGKVKLGTNLNLAYFDQLREQLDDEKSVAENLGDGNDSVMINGQPRHILGYLQDFLFTPERARTPVRFLSGGERNRVLLARLFAKPANVIVLDEPTNDLDAETLELLEDRLVAFNGTVLLVSHDREFLNNVVSSTIAFENGNVREYVGGYDDWLRQRATTLSEEPVRAKATASATKTPEVKPPLEEKAKKRKLSYKEQQELNALPSLIEQTELAIAALHTAMSQPNFYQQPGAVIAQEQAKLQTLEAKLTEAYARLELLDQ